ncbi:Predicted glycosyl transferase [Sulfitobacter marinus]|uniref:Predicted glycosyl transferase n=1 Tax=Sulfitobacter marinus TaxID=394264 RepID=A0A1I6ULH9_9RHOB|nr:glycosyltransferase [Sulfitobacter marinus]SFT02336.1 Predicted glycosyl transferase [Sulfitobacter marinus]
MKVCIVVTHLLGTGHLARALTLGRAYRDAGHETIVVSGGMPAPQLRRDDVEVVQLPPLRSDGVNFARLLDGDGTEADAALFDTRTRMLIDTVQSQEPDVLITELFPFGRRILRAEFTALLNAAQDLPRRPLICASVRDILAPPSKPAKAALADDLIAQFYNAVLVHSDAELAPLSLSWPVSDALAGKLRYTGYVAPPAAAPHVDGLGSGEILVSAGGGDVGQHVFDTALTAAKLDPEKRQWRFLLGGQDAAERSADLMRSAPANVTVEPARPEFRQMLYHAAASVSLCGYNTALDILQSGTHAVFIPFDAGSEVEQGLRADALAQMDGIAVLRNADLSADTLLNDVTAVLNAPRRAPRTKGFDGAAQTVQITRDMRETQTCG